MTDGAMSYTLLMGALCYSVWLVVVMAMKPHRQAISQLGVETVADKSGYRVPEPEEPIDASGLMSCLGIHAGSICEHFSGIKTCVTRPLFSHVVGSDSVTI